MTCLPEPQYLPSDLSSRTLTLSLSLRAGECFTIRSCEVVGRWFRNRISFQENRSLDDVLVRKLANAIRAQLLRLPGGAHVLALPDFLVEVPGLALSGLHVMVMDAKDGCRSAILRFSEFIGAINSAFCIELGFQEASHSYGEKLAMNVLEDICLPILNLCRSFAALQLENPQTLPRGFADRAREFEFQTELLKRYIHNAGLAETHGEAHHPVTRSMAPRYFLPE